MCLTHPCVSLEAPISEDGQSELGELVEDRDSESAFDLAWRAQRAEHLRRALDLLPERERTVIELRFGLTGAAPYTLVAIGRMLGVTRERVRQIEGHALKKLRQLPEAQALRDVESSLDAAGATAALAA